MKKKRNLNPAQLQFVYISHSWIMIRNGPADLTNQPTFCNLLKSNQTRKFHSFYFPAMDPFGSSLA